MKRREFVGAVLVGGAAGCLNCAGNSLCSTEHPGGHRRLTAAIPEVGERVTPVGTTPPAARRRRNSPNVAPVEALPALVHSGFLVKGDGMRFAKAILCLTLVLGLVPVAGSAQENKSLRERRLRRSRPRWSR